jgi:hypothetical protein
MVDVAPNSVNKAGCETLWYRPRLPIPQTGAHVLLGTGANGAPRRFSTIVENSVENSGLSELAVMKSLVLPESAYGEGGYMAIFSTFSRL